MKEQTAVLLTKAACYLIIGLGTPFGAGVAQWVNTGEWPPRIVWLVVIVACAVSGATNLLAFLSQSYGNWKEERKNGNGTVSPTSPQP